MRVKTFITAFNGCFLIVGLAALLSVTTVGALPARAQVSVTADELLAQLAPGDRVRIAASKGPEIEGIVKRIHVDKNSIEIDSKAKGWRGEVLAIGELGAVERIPDSVKNGTLIGLGIGAGVAAAQFVYALAVDYNEIDEWAGIYVATGAAYSGIGALIGWRIDAARSKPRIRYEAAVSPAPKITWSVRPFVTRDQKGLTLNISF
jgi:hypothetical protein